MNGGQEGNGPEKQGGEEDGDTEKEPKKAKILEADNGNLERRAK